MTVLPILNLGDPALRRIAEPLDLQALATPRWQTFCHDLVETMRHANGAGLAAVQVGVHVRIAALEVKNNPRYPYKPNIPLTIAVNPILTPLSDETFENYEGCLSVPGLRGIVSRYRYLHVRYWDPAGNEHAIEVSGLTAGTWQHECDHLDGLLFVDRVSDSKTLTTWDNFKAFHEAAFVERVRALGSEPMPRPGE